jgi:Protein of unknown function (DUF3617)
MRWIAIIPVLVVAACGGAAEENKIAAKAQRLTPGLWELSSEVTAFAKVDAGPPAIDTPVGTRATESVCVTGSARPRTAFFAGEGYQCRYDNFYARNGRMNVTMICGREGLSGSIPLTADGTFEAESVTYTRDIRTSLAGDGDVQITARVTGRRTGECPPEAAGDNESAGEEEQNRS